MLRSAFAILVILAKENNWQFPQPGQIQRFVKGTFVSGTIAKKRHSDTHRLPCLGLLLKRQRCPYRHGNSTSHNPIGTHNAQVKISHMQRATFTSTITTFTGS